MSANRRIFVPLVVFLMAGLLTEPACAFKTFSVFGGNVHENITRAAIGSEVSNECFKYIDKGNTSQDLNLTYFFDEQRHADDDQIEEAIAYIHKEFDDAVAAAGKADTSKEARNAALEGLGRMFHTIQDIYSHSNYVELHLKDHIPYESIKPFLPFDKNWTRPQGLRTGYFDATELAGRSTAISKLRERYKYQGVNLPPDAAYRKLRGETFEQALQYATDESHDVLHHDINKDNGNSPEGKLVDPRSGLSLFRIARTLAGEDTTRWWGHTLSTIKGKYGKRAPKIIAALTGKQQPEEPEKKPEPKPEPQRVTFTGLAVDEKGVPVPNVTFDLSGTAVAKITVPSEGASLFYSSPVGDYTLKATAPGFLPGEAHFTVKPDMEIVKLNERGVKIILQRIPVPAVDFLVSAMDESGKLVPNATINLSGPTVGGMTSPTGQVNFTGTPAGSYTVKASAKGYLAGETAVQVGPDNKAAVVTLKKEPPPAAKPPAPAPAKPQEKVNFVVLAFDQHGSPVPNVTVELIGPATGKGFGPKGRVDFAGFPDGTYLIKASANGYKSESMPLTVEPNMENIGGLNGISILLEKKEPQAQPPTVSYPAGGSMWDPFVGTWNGYARIVKSGNPEEVGQSFQTSLRIVPYGATYALYVGSDMFGSPNGYQVSRQGDTLTVVYKGPVYDTEGQFHGQTTDSTVQLTVRGGVMTGGQWMTVYDKDSTFSMALSLSFQKA